MPITPLKDILFGEQNAVSVSRRSLPTDDELMRRMRSDYASSREFVDNSGYMTARVIETPPGLIPPPFSWSSLSTESRTDTRVVVVKAHLIEASVAPGYDEEIRTLDDQLITSNSLKLFQYEFIGVRSDLPIPTEGDDIWVDFENRKTLTGPRYHGIKNSVSTNGGVNPALVNQNGVTADQQAAANAAYTNNRSIQGRATGVAAVGFRDKNGNLVTAPSLSAQQAKPIAGSSVPISPITPKELADQQKSLGVIKQSSPYSTAEKADTHVFTRKLSKSGSYQAHPGSDIATPYGSLCYSIKDGIVVELGEVPQDNVNKGIIVGIVFHTADPISLPGPPLKGARYLHLSETYVGLGTVVSAKQIIGRTGTAGNSESGGPHLHLETYQGYEPKSRNAYYNFLGNRTSTEKEMEAAINATDIISSFERSDVKKKEIDDLAKAVRDYKIKEGDKYKQSEDIFMGVTLTFLQDLRDDLNKAKVFVNKIELYGYGLYEENSQADRDFVKSRLKSVEKAINSFRRTT
jgi:murein DD-endopeptidase MepM/ murein hydrolase activator NlpD